MLTRELRALLWFFSSLAFGAGALLYLLSGNTDDTFSWTIKPTLTAAFLGGAYWAAFVLTGDPGTAVTTNPPPAPAAAARP